MEIEKNTITAMNEAVFYFTFGSKMKYMKALLEEILKKEIHEIIPLNTKLMKDNLMSKCKYLDYVIKTNQGILNIEINNFTDIGIINRNVIYLCQLVANSSKKGKSYKNVINSVQINFCKLGKDVAEREEYTLKANEHAEGYPDELTNMIKIVVINVDKFTEKYYNKDVEFIEDNKMVCTLALPLKEVKELAKGNELLMEYENDFGKVLDDEDFVKWISPEEEDEKMKQTYIEIGLEQGKEQGKEDGIIQGKKENAIDIAKKMLFKKMDINLISEMTGLSIEEINEISK